MKKDFDLSLSQRLQIIEILPREGSIVTLRLIHDLRQKLSPTAEEIKEFGIKVIAPGQIQFPVEANVPKKMSFMPAEIDQIKTNLKDLSDKNKLEINMIGLYDTFFQ